MESSRYFIRLAYEGTRFHGWQIQNNAESVQQVLTDCMRLVLRSEIRLTGAGRTDRGVHATEYFAHFDLPRILSVSDREKLVFKLNRFLPPDIAIREIFPVKPQVNARFTATSRTYRYRIHTSKDPFLEGRSFFLYGKLDIGRMQAGADRLLKVSDFTSFSKVDTDTKTNICRVTDATWELHETELHFVITADRFLRNMVRAIVGTLVDVGKGRITLSQLDEIILKKDRCEAGDSVPACGLYLEKICYPPDIYLPE